MAAPAQRQIGQRLACAVLRTVSRHQPIDQGAVASDNHLFQVGLGLAAHLDFLVQHGCRRPFVAAAEPGGVLGMALLDVEVLGVSPACGDAPANALVVAHDDAWDAGHRRAGEAQAAVCRLDVVLVPQRGHRDRQMGIVGKQRPARGGALRADDPVVAAGHRGLTKPPAGGLVGRSHTASGLGKLLRAGDAAQVRHDDWVACRVERLELGRPFRSKRLQQLKAQQFALPVLAQRPAQHLEHAERVLCLPGVRLEAGDGKLGRQTQAIGRNEGVDAGRIGFERSGLFGSEGLPILLRGTPEADHPAPPIGLKRGRAKALGQRAARQASGILHLKQAILGVDVALGEERVALRLGVNVRHAPPVAHDLDRAGQPRQLDFALRTRQRPAKDVPNHTDESQCEESEEDEGDRDKEKCGSHEQAPAIDLSLEIGWDVIRLPPAVDPPSHAGRGNGWRMPQTRGRAFPGIDRGPGR